MKYILTCPYNTTQIAKKELSLMGYKATITSQTSLEFDGDEAAIARININSRVGNKLYLVLATGLVQDFEGLFSLISTVDWHKYIGLGQPVLTSALTRHSQLTSIPSIQAMSKKAITKKLLGNDERWDEDNNLQAIDIMITIDKNMCYVLLNTTGESLHERGYRQHVGEAPIKENLAAALILSSGRKFSTPLVDPFCGAGTMCIEASMIAKNIAPGLNRGFAFHGFDRYPAKFFEDAVTVAEAKVMLDKQHTIIGYDLDPTMIEIAKDNAKNAGVSDCIDFSQRDFMTTSIMPEKQSVISSHSTVISSDSEKSLSDKKFSIVTNPPYGERLKLSESMNLYKRLLALYETHENINGGFITNAPDVKTLYDYKLRKETDYYNGPIETIFYKIARL